MFRFAGWFVLLRRVYAAARSSQVAKKKKSVALFEVISKTRDKNPDSEVAVPDWIKPPGQSDQQNQEAQAPDAQGAAAREPVPPEPEAQGPASPDEVAAPEAPSPPTLPTTSTWEPRRSSEAPKTSDLPVWSTAGGRLTLSLNYVSCLVVSMGVLLLIIGAFVLGRMTASDPAPPGRSGKPVVKRQVGKYYLVIETLAGKTREARAEAERIVKFCNANGEPSQVQLLGDNLIVWSLTPFDSPKKEEVLAHALFVQNELGAKYARKYGSKYKFIQPQKNGKLAPDLYPYTKSP